jgi:hypothetical protein
MTRHVFIAVAIALVVSMWGCEAFNSDNTPFVGFDEKDIPAIPGLVAGAYEGLYEGTLTLADVEGSCPSVTEAEGDVVNATFDVIHSGDFISVKFEDETEEHGKLVDGKVTVVKRSADNVRLYEMDFDEGGVMTGIVEVIPVVNGDLDGQPCAMYQIECTRGE